MLETEEKIVAELKKYEKPHSIQRLYRDHKSSIYINTCVRTATELGWFVGSVLTRLTDEEKAFFTKISKRIPDYDKLRYWSVSKIINRQVGGMLTPVKVHPPQEEFPYLPALVELKTIFDDIVYLKAWQYLTLKERHPRGRFFMTGWYHAEDKNVLVNEKNTVAMLTPFNVKK